jgi:hypothetical protein
MADAGRLDFDEDLAFPRPVELDFFDRQRLARLPRNRCLGFHVFFLLESRRRRKGLP